MKHVLLSILLLALAQPAAALDLACEPTSSPLLKITTLRVTRGVLPPSQSRDLTLLCRNRQWLIARISSGATEFPLTGTLQRGQLTAAEFQLLTSRMALARVGQMSDCAFGLNSSALSSQQFTWFGRGQRTNRFFFYGGHSDAPACTAEELEFLLTFTLIPSQTVSFP